MMKRRQFIQQSLMAASAAVVFPAFVPVDKKKIGLQLYTLRDVILSDVQGIMRQVSEIGYKKIETYGYRDGMLFGKKAKEFSDIVKSLGMQITSGHYGTGQTDTSVKGTLSNDWERAVADAKEAGQEFMIVAYLDKRERNTIDDYKKVCALINRQAEVCKQYGIRLGYHNHAFEFDKIDSQVPYDLMLKELDPKLVSMEMDIFWIVAGGQDPIQYINKYPGRFEQWHVKDMDKTDKTRNTIAGAGVIPFKSIFEHADHAGLKNFYVEHDNFPASPIECVRGGFSNISKLL